jgi:hypothetical protein
MMTVTRLEWNTRNIKTIITIIPAISTEIDVLMGGNSRKGSISRQGSGNRSGSITGSNSGSGSRMMTMTRMERNPRNIQTIVILAVIPAIAAGNTASSQGVRRTRTNSQGMRRTSTIGGARGRMMTMARVEGDARNVKIVFTVIPAITTERRDTLDLDLDISLGLSLSLLGMRVEGEVWKGNSVLINRVIPSASMSARWVGDVDGGVGGVQEAPASELDAEAGGGVNGFSVVEASFDGGLLVGSQSVLFFA